MGPLGSMLSGARIGLLVWAAALLPAMACAAAPADPIETGRRIYQEGRLSSGTPLAGVRGNGILVAGEAAACMNCHRPSGMGSVEGDILIPPITGRFLQAQAGDMAYATMDPRQRKLLNQRHPPYEPDLLARAIREGVDSRGVVMNPMMPRYHIPDADLNALAAYLSQLSAQWSPGVTETSIRLATVVAPGLEPGHVQALLDTLRTAVVQKNASTMPGRRHMVSAPEFVLKTERTWDVDVWELQGPPSTWDAQLQAYYAKGPVFALLSGFSGVGWEPVHAFCERQRMPCWFPSVDLPGARSGKYALYFSRGVVLEAEVLARHLADPGNRPQGRLVQVFPGDEVGSTAALALAQALEGRGISIQMRPVQGSTPAHLKRALSGVNPGDTVMLWLRPAELQALESLAPPSSRLYFSGDLAGVSLPLPLAWKKTARVIYPFELPEQRAANLANFHAWMRLRNLPLVDERRQSEIYFAVNYLSDTLADMLDNLYRDYLLERTEQMIGRREGSRTEQEVRDRRALRAVAIRAIRDQTGLPAASAEGFGARQGGSTTVYPRLTLAPGQRFASKGAYVVGFDENDPDRLVAETGWIVP